MNGVNQPLIEEMAQELQPVRAMQLRHGLALVALALVGTIILVGVIDGIWTAGLAGSASPYFFITNGLLLLLGFASATSVVTMATPRVGNRHDGPRWAMAMLGVVPVAALVTLLASGGVTGALNDPYGLTCFGSGLVSGLLTGFVLFTWLRRGAPVSPNTAGLHLGVAAGALGTAVYGLACPLDGIAHLGLWHIAPVAVAALIGRFALPRFLAW